MRKNFFGEQIAQPDDDHEACMDAWSPGPIEEAELNREKDETFLVGGELIDEDGDRYKFDGFASHDAAREWLLDTFNLDASDITEVE